MLTRLGRFLTRWPRAVILVTLAIVAVAAAGSLRLHVITDYRAYFDPRNPDFRQLAALEARFGPSDDILLAYAPASGQATTPQAVQRVAELADALREMPFAGRVTSIADLPVAIGTGETAQVTTLRVLASGAQPPDPALWDAAVDEVARLTTGSILARDRSIAAAHVTIDTPVPASFRDSKAVNDYVLALRDHMEREMGAEGRVLMAGVLPYYHSILELAMRDIALLIPVCLLVAILILRSLLASWRATWCCCIPVVAAVLTAVGMHGWIGYPVTVASLVVPIMVLVISLAFMVHLADTYLDLRPELPDAATAAIQSLRANFLPLSLTTGTTLLGFLTMNISVSPPYRHMGNSVLIGVLAAAVFAVLLMPALLCWIDPPYWRAKMPLRRALDWLSEVITVPIRSPWLLAGGALLILGLLGCIRLNTIDDNISQWFSDASRIRQENIEVNARLTGMQQLYYELPAGAPGGVREPEYLARVERFAAWLRQQPNVAAVRALPDLIRTLARNFGVEDLDRGLPRDAATVEQLLFTYELSAPPGDQGGGLIDSERSASLVHVSLRNMPGDQFQAFDARAQDWLRQNLPELEVAPGNSAVMMFSKMAHENIPPMILGTLGVLALTSLVVTIGLRSLRLGLICLVPCLVPIGLAFGVWGLISGHVGIALSVVSTAALGIIVDDTIHVIARYKAARKGGAVNVHDACEYTVRHVGGAITTTTLVLSAGVGLLGLSSVQPTHEMGIWMAITFIFAWLCTLVLLPQLLTRLDR
jgi:predicted RND superfamily exporter protein